MEVFVHVETSLSPVNHLIVLSLYSLRLSSSLQLVWLATKLQRKLPVLSVQSWNYRHVLWHSPLYMDDRDPESGP